MTVSLKDVASRVGVSPQAVSLALRGSPEVSESRRREIVAAAQAMGYRPNVAARALRGSSTRTLGVLTSRVNEPLITGLENEVWDRGYRMLLASCDQDPCRFETHVQDLLGHQVDGMMLIYPQFYTAPQQVRKLLPAALPRVLVDALVDWRPAPTESSIRIDRRVAMAVITERAVALGHRSFAFFCHKLNHTTPEKLSGVTTALAAHGLPWSDARIIEGTAQVARAEELSERLFDMDPFPTCVVCSSDALAIGVTRGLARRGLRVPEDVSVIGHDNAEMGQYAATPLTTAQQPLKELGRQAAGMLLDRLVDSALTAEHRVLSAEPVWRASLGPVPGAGQGATPQKRLEKTHG